MRLEGGLVERRYFYIIFLWDPVDRYLSDWRHVQRGATWKTAELRCGNQSWAKIFPNCYEVSRLPKVVLSEIMMLRMILLMSTVSTATGLRWRLLSS